VNEPTPVSSPDLFGQTFLLLQAGGVFMFFILACSVVAATVVLQRLLVLRWNRVLPPNLVAAIERLGPGSGPDAVAGLVASAAADPSPLGRIVAAAHERRGQDAEGLRAGVEAVAREEVGRLQNGLAVLEVVITVAPLFGLLGTVSGLVGVFGVYGDSSALENPDPARIAAGIAEALYTTIGGLVVAVPVVMAHSFLGKRIERMASRMEVLVSSVFLALTPP
jgi:biopolymer transport protein ExbB